MYYYYHLEHIHGDRIAYAFKVFIKILYIYGILNVSGGVTHFRSSAVKQ